MPWFKVDDAFHSHPKTLATSPAALGLWTIAGSWAAANLTDGFVPDFVLTRLIQDSVPLAEELVRQRLWVKAKGGYRFHAWREYQPSKEEVNANRRAASNRQAVFRNPELRKAIRVRDGDDCRYCGRAVQWTDKRSDLGGTYDHVDPQGDSTYDNLVVCCRGCNARKGRRTPSQAGMMLRDSTPELNRIQIPESTTNRPPTRPDPTITTYLESKDHSSPDVPREQVHRVEDEPRSKPVQISAAKLARVYTSKVPLSDPGKVSAVVWNAIGCGYDQIAITRGLETLARESRPVTADTLRIAIDGRTPTPARTAVAASPYREGW